MFTGKAEEFRGVYALLLTPFNEDLSLIHISEPTRH